MKKIYHFDEEQYEMIEKYFYSLHKKEIVFEDSETIFTACKEIVSCKFGLETDNRDQFFRNVLDLYALMRCVQPWYIPLMDTTRQLEK